MPLEHLVLEERVSQDHSAFSAQPAGVEAPPALPADLMDPAVWQELLLTYARSTNLAVALVDAEGRLLGECINPQPLWSLLHAQTQAVSGGCPFSLDSREPCTCVADALAKGRVVWARDRTWLKHFAVPLVLGEHSLGALVAGQVFDQYPEQLPIEEVAKKCRLSPQRVWQKARLEHPVKQATLRVYSDLLATLGHTSLQTRYHTLREAERLAEMTWLRDCAVTAMAERERADEERRRLEARLQHAQKLECLGVLAGGIAHDFNNLLTAILGNASLARAALPPDSDVRAVLQQIEAASERAAELTKQMLAYAGKGRFVIQPVNLSHLVKEMASLLQSVLSKKAVRRFDLAPGLPRIEGDATQIRQVVMNLMTNASEALGEESGTLTLRTGVVHADQDGLAAAVGSGELPEGDYVTLEVSDTGCGMDQATLAKIFDPFFTTKFTGRGLGLSAVQGIVRGHRGCLTVDSVPGQGTTFRILFPSSGRAEAEPIPAAPPQAGRRDSRTILVVDDEEVLRDLGRRILEQAGYQVLLAGDGQEAVTVFRQHQASLAAVLLDLTMPVMDGVEAHRQMRRLCPEVPVLLVSGYHQQELSTQFAGQGFAGFVQKPCRPEDLLAALRGALQQVPSWEPV